MIDDVAVIDRRQQTHQSYLVDAKPGNKIVRELWYTSFLTVKELCCGKWQRVQIQYLTLLYVKLNCKLYQSN